MNKRVLVTLEELLNRENNLPDIKKVEEQPSGDPKIQKLQKQQSDLKEKIEKAKVGDLKKQLSVVGKETVSPKSIVGSLEKKITSEK